MRVPTRDAHVSRAGFTLVETLTSVVVLILLVLFVVQLVNSTAAVSTAGRMHMDADDQARIVFDRMAGDFERMLKRPDVDYIFFRAAGNDSMFFYSEAPAYVDAGIPSTSALVGYRINSNFQIERLGKTLSWDGAPSSSGGGMMFLTYSGATLNTNSLLASAWPLAIGTAPYTSGTDGDYHVLSDGVLRLEICFQRTDGKYYNSPSANAPATFSTDGNVYGFPSDLSAIIVAIAILDDTSRKIAPNMAGLAAAFADPTDSALASTPPMLMAQTWNGVLDSGGLSPAIIPAAAGAQVRIYQRAFYLNTQ